MASRKRGNSVASPTPTPRQKTTTSKTTQPSKPRPEHLSDPFLDSFLDPSFDPVDYLNSVLPSLRISSIKTMHATSTSSASASTPASTSASSSTKPSMSLAEICNETQDLATKLNMHSTRLTAALTQMTDDILRGSGRLAYEVELMRGEVLGLSEALDETLQDDIKKFVPEGIDSTTVVPPRPTATLDAAAPPPSAMATESKDTTKDVNPESSSDFLKLSPNDPECIHQLQRLTVVRERLESVIRTFGEAMEFVFPPSELSVASSFLSVSAPEPGSDDQSLEEKGQQVLQKLRQEIADLLDDKDDPITGVENATSRIEKLKDLNIIWQGTVEEKGRTKFIESLVLMVTERHEQLLRASEAKAAAEKAARTPGGKAAATSSTQESAPVSGYAGFMSQFQKIREAVKQ
ncbi:hypothetical protein CFIMG_008719RA00001 [Ceratocystis fimbriata CBS 114723]|uniref:Uncharacterized protein n=1 Tax=Ceratocystis fimbriata CBS 114723 TaxID=1035309 RepID=A0A2C5X041_9PEZI|nr:hypothetical protein CFIMG_008719RA00001 [Ceratocystis fimbriata CBS 114723]